jgi:hypothetical protein
MVERNISISYNARFTFYTCLNWRITMKHLTENLDDFVFVAKLICAVAGLALIGYGIVKPVPNTVNQMNVAITTLTLLMALFCVQEFLLNKGKE